MVNLNAVVAEKVVEAVRAVGVIKRGKGPLYGRGRWKECPEAPPSKEVTLGHPFDTTVALVPLTVMKGHIVTSEVQTELSVQVVLPNTEFKALCVLVDFWCQTVALANPNVF